MGKKEEGKREKENGGGLKIKKGEGGEKGK